MILKIQSYFYQIYKIIFVLLLTNISNLHGHNLFNGCNEDCINNKTINIEIKLNNKNDQMNIKNKNSCLNKSLCRG